MAIEYGSENLPFVKKKSYTYGKLVSTLVTETICLWEDKDESIPEIGDTLESFVCIDATAEQQDFIGIVRATYEKAVTELPETTFDESTSAVELPIQQHPDFSSWAAEWDSEKEAFKSTSDKYGVTSYVDGSTEVIKTEYFGTMPASIFDKVGKRQAPGGDYTGGAGKWLIIGTSRRKVGDGIYARETRYQYSDIRYDNDIYDNA